METKRINLSELEFNNGQIDGLPVNPRQWTRTDVDRIAKSLKETPELFEARPIIAVRHGDKYVILGGNLRYAGARANKDADAPCVILPDDTPIEKMKEIVIKDNGSFGAWDFDALANGWDDLPLVDWGVPVWNTESADSDNLPDEIQGRDLEPDALPKIEGDDNTAMERIIICYPAEDAEKLAALLGVAAIDKVVYNLSEFLG